MYKRIVTLDDAISAAGDALAPQIIFEGLTERLLPPNAPEYTAKGWELRYSANHGSMSLAAQYMDTVKTHFEKVLVPPPPPKH